MDYRFEAHTDRKQFRLAVGVGPERPAMLVFLDQKGRVFIKMRMENGDVQEMKIKVKADRVAHAALTVKPKEREHEEQHRDS